MKRTDASEILKEVLELGGSPNWSVECKRPDSCELQLRPRILTMETLKHIAERHGFGHKEDNGKITIF